MRDSIDRLPHSDVVALARRARTRIRNAEMDKDRILSRLFAVGVGGGAALATGYFMSGLHQQAVSDGTAGTDEDPTKFMGIDLDLWAGFGLTAIGVVASGKAGQTRKLGAYVEAAGTGILNGVAYAYGMDMARDA